MKFIYHRFGIFSHDVVLSSTKYFYSHHPAFESVYDGLDSFFSHEKWHSLIALRSSGTVRFSVLENTEQ